MVLEKAFSGCGYTEEANTGPLKKEVPYINRAMCVDFRTVVTKYKMLFLTRFNSNSCSEFLNYSKLEQSF